MGKILNKPRKSDEDPEEIQIDYSYMIGSATPITTWSTNDKVRKDIKEKRIYGFIRPKFDKTNKI